MSAGSNLTVIGLALVGLAVLAPTVPSRPPPARAERPVPTAAAPDKPDESRPISGLAGSTLERDADGHFYAEAQVNGARIRFMVDSGASVVVLTPEDAQRAGIALPSQRVSARGLGGEVEVIPVTIDRLALGSLEARAVRAAVAEDLPFSLLGQSFLAQVDSVEISGDRMVLR